MRKEPSFVVQPIKDMESQSDLDPIFFEKAQNDHKGVTCLSTVTVTGNGYSCNRDSIVVDILLSLHTRTNVISFQNKNYLRLMKTVARLIFLH